MIYTYFYQSKTLKHILCQRGIRQELVLKMLLILLKLFLFQFLTKSKPNQSNIFKINRKIDMLV